MREIKFRAYFKVKGELFCADILAWNLTDDEITVDWKGQITSVDAESIVAIVQYTGLKDKDGKEIYEGDIIIAHDKMGNYKSLKKPQVVKWDQDNLRFIVVWHNVDKLEIEVIGNIHENPELLKEAPEQ